MEKSNTINEFGIKIDTYSAKEFVEHITYDLESGKRSIQVMGINIEQIALLKKDRNFRGYCNSSDYVNIDGTSVCLYLKILGYKHVNRALCADIFYKLMDYANDKGESIYLLGAAPDTIGLVVKNLKEKYPNITIAGYHDGYFKDEKNIVNEIRNLKPTFLFLGMPSPMKERFITTYKNDINAGIYYGIGGMFDIIAGKAERAPKFWQKIGLEWLYRITQNPKGHTKRVFRALGPCLSVLISNLFKKK